MSARPRIAVALAATVLAAGVAQACLNYEGTNVRGERVEPWRETGDDLRAALRKPNDPEVVANYSHYVVDAARKEPSTATRNDLAVVLVRFGRLSDAIRLLQIVERSDPGKYETAANLGTAYELAGRDRDALRWIREGMRRNPESHYGTEWLHARILEAKLAPATIPRNGASILGLDFGNAAIPARPRNLPNGNDGKPVTLFELGAALHFQLGERTDFVPPTEPIVAGLLLDWANLEFAAGTLESALVLYDEALRYGNPQADLIARRKREAERLLDAAGDHAKKPGACELCDLPDDD